MLTAHQILQNDTHKIEPEHVAQQVPAIDVKEHVGEWTQEFVSTTQLDWTKLEPIQNYMGDDAI